MMLPLRHVTAGALLLAAAAAWPGCASGTPETTSSGGQVCGPGTTQCGDFCVDTSIDPVNCGDCRIACSGGASCVAGMCALACAGGTTRCGDACADTAVDPANCGACDHPCSPGEACVASACKPACGPGTTLCGATCTDTAFDPDHCGICETTCPGFAHASPACVAGVCGSVCAAGYADCDANPGNGCEIDVAVDVLNCGACGKICMGGGECAMGVCGAPPDPCTGAVDVSAHGTFTGNTCGGYTGTSTMCGGAGAPVIFFHVMPGSYSPTLTAGFALEYRAIVGAFDCTNPGPGQCSTTSFPGGFAVTVPHYLVIQKTTATGCGAFTLTI